jgi:hypothetical protein
VGIEAVRLDVSRRERRELVHDVAEHRELPRGRGARASPRRTRRLGVRMGPLDVHEHRPNASHGRAAAPGCTVVARRGR